MPDTPEPPPPLYLDACVAINLLASGVAEDVLLALPFEVRVTQWVYEHEVLYIRGEDSEGEVPDAEAPSSAELEVRVVGLQSLVESGALAVADPLTEAESETFVELAMDLDDGEAETAAAAIHRGASIATDDRKAIRVLGARQSAVTIYRTSALLKHWADAQGIGEDSVRECLVAIQEYASFVPPRDDPERGWWVGIVGRGAP